MRRCLPVGLPAIEALREALRIEANCQIVSYLGIPRGMADPFGFFIGDELVGHAAMWNRNDHAGRIMEIVLRADEHGKAEEWVTLLRSVSTAMGFEVQSNLPLAHRVASGLGSIQPERWLFGRFKSDDDPVEVRPALPEEVKYPSHPDSREFVLEEGTAKVGHAGYLCHYNPPYADVFMEIEEPFRRRGHGKALVHAVCHKAILAGKIPAARCDLANEGSRRTLVAAGFEVIGSIDSGPFRP